MRVKYNPEVNLSHVITLMTILVSVLWFGSKVDTTIKTLVEITQDHETRIRANEIENARTREWRGLMGTGGSDGP